VKIGEVVSKIWLKMQTFVKKISISEELKCSPRRQIILRRKALLFGNYTSGGGVDGGLVVESRASMPKVAGSILGDVGFFRFRVNQFLVIPIPAPMVRGNNTKKFFLELLLRAEEQNEIRNVSIGYLVLRDSSKFLHY